MGGKVTAVDVRMAAALAGGVPNVAEFCRVQGISRETFYKWRRRFAAEGLAGLEERSRRPLRSPGATPAAVEELVVRLRGELAAEGLDCGPQSICWRLTAELGAAAPSRATVARVLTRRGLVTRQPRKRPRASLHRFAAARVNEMWQSDWTAWTLADGTAGLSRELCKGPWRSDGQSPGEVQCERVECSLPAVGSGAEVAAAFGVHVP